MLHQVGDVDLLQQVAPLRPPPTASAISPSPALWPAGQSADNGGGWPVRNGAGRAASRTGSWSSTGPGSSVRRFARPGVWVTRLFGLVAEKRGREGAGDDGEQGGRSACRGPAGVARARTLQAATSVHTSGFWSARIRHISPAPPFRVVRAPHVASAVRLAGREHVDHPARRPPRHARRGVPTHRRGGLSSVSPVSFSLPSRSGRPPSSSSSSSSADSNGYALAATATSRHVPGNAPPSAITTRGAESTPFERPGVSPMRTSSFAVSCPVRPLA